MNDVKANGEKKPEHSWYRQVQKDKKSVRLFLENGACIVGNITWRADYSLGFVPTHHDKELHDLGMEKDKESLVMKGFIRVVTPV